MRTFALLFLLSTFAFAQEKAPTTAGPHTYTLKATAKTVAWGNYDATAEPNLRIQSGDTVIFETLLTNSPTGLERAGVAPDQVQQSLRDVYADFPANKRGPGGHILNGPVYIEGAEPGDTLEIHIQKIELAISYAYNGFRFGAGFLTNDFPYSRTKIIPLDREKMIGKFGLGIEIPLHPFFGSMGVAPPESFEAKLVELEKAHEQGVSGTSVEITENELNGLIQRSAGQLPIDASSPSGPPTEPAGNVPQIAMTGDEISGQFISQLYGKDVYVTISAKLSAENGHLVIHTS